jgi:hypothetical protein
MIIELDFVDTAQSQMTPAVVVTIVQGLLLETPVHTMVQLYSNVRVRLAAHSMPSKWCVYDLLINYIFRSCHMSLRFAVAFTTLDSMLLFEAGADSCVPCKHSQLARRLPL